MSICVSAATNRLPQADSFVWNRLWKPDACLVYEEDPDQQIKKRSCIIMHRAAEYCAEKTVIFGENQKYWSTAHRPRRSCPHDYTNSKPMGGKMYMIPELNAEFLNKCHFSKDRRNDRL